MNKIVSFITNMWWNAYIFSATKNSQNKSQDTKENYGFKTNKSRPHIKELDNFEVELISLIKLIKYRRTSNNL